MNNDQSPRAGDGKAEAAEREAFDAAFVSANGFHTKAELAAEWEKGLSGVMFRAGLAATTAAAPAGFVPVSVLEAVFDTIKRANTDGSICDTIWHGTAETLFDFIEVSIEQAAAPAAAPAWQLTKVIELLEEVFVDGFNAVETYNDTRLNNGPDTWKEMDQRYGYSKQLATILGVKFQAPATGEAV